MVFVFTYRAVRLTAHYQRVAQGTINLSKIDTCCFLTIPNQECLRTRNIVVLGNICDRLDIRSLKHRLCRIVSFQVLSAWLLCQTEGETVWLTCSV